MRTYMFFAVLFAMFIFAIVAGYKPDMIQKEYERAKAPIAKVWNERQDEAWRLAKDKEWQAWAKQIRMPADCTKPRNAIRELECRNIVELEANTFERTWVNKVRSGWKPDGVF